MDAQLILACILCRYPDQGSKVLAELEGRDLALAKLLLDLTAAGSLTVRSATVKISEWYNRNYASYGFGRHNPHDETGTSVALENWFDLDGTNTFHFPFLHLANVKDFLWVGAPSILWLR